MQRDCIHSGEKRPNHRSAAAPEWIVGKPEVELPHPTPKERDLFVKRLAVAESAAVFGPPPASGRAPRVSPVAAPPTYPLA